MVVKMMFTVVLAFLSLSSVHATTLYASVATEQVRGEIYMLQRAGVQIGANITLELHHIDATLCPVAMTWHIHAQAIPDDNVASASGYGPGNTSNSYCAKTGGHWDPTVACGSASAAQNIMVGNTSVCKVLYPDSGGVQACAPDDDITTCEMGDLSGVLGYTIPAVAGKWEFHHPYITNIAVLANKAIVFHCGGPRVICLDFVEVDDITTVIPDRAPDGGEEVGDIYYTNWNSGDKCKHPVISWDNTDTGTDCQSICTMYADDNSYTGDFCCGYQDNSSPHTCHISASGDTDTTSSGSWKKCKGEIVPPAPAPTASEICQATCQGLIAIGVCEGSNYVLCDGGCPAAAGVYCASDIFNYDSCVSKQTKNCETSCYNTLVQPCYDELVDPCYDSCNSAITPLCIQVMEEAADEAADEGCEMLCADAAVDADALGGGPEDPAADALAVAIEASCADACSTVAESGISYTDDATGYAKAMCTAMGM